MLKKDLVDLINDLTDEDEVLLEVPAPAEDTTTSIYYDIVDSGYRNSYGCHVLVASEHTIPLDELDG